MPRAKAAKKLRELDSIEHHCSQCNRPKIHKVFEHEDGVLMQCPCGHEFVDVIIADAKTGSEETRIDSNDSDES